MSDIVTAERAKVGASLDALIIICSLVLPEVQRKDGCKAAFGVGGNNLS